MELIKSKLDNFLDDLSNEFRGVIRIENFITNHYVIASNSFRDYTSGQSISRELITDLSGHINMVIGCAYNIYPYMIVISLHIALESQITRIFITTICLVLFMLNYIMNMVSSWFPQKNLDISKCLYRLSWTNSLTGLRLKLKID